MAQRRKKARKPAPRRSPSRAAAKPARRTARAARKPARKPARSGRPAPAPKPARKPARKPSRPARTTKPGRAKTPARPTRTKKPAARPTKARGRGRRVTTLPIPPARARAKPRRKALKTEARAPETIVFEDRESEQAPEESTTVVPAEVGDGEQLDARRYVAVVSEIDVTEAFPAQLEAPPLPERRRREVDSYPTDIPIAIVAALLAASAFVPWYTDRGGFGISVNGWESGTLGPAIVFLAAGSLALVVLRRLRVHVTLPVEESLAHEAVGWISLVAAVVKSRIRPTLGDLELATSNRVFIAVGAAAVLIVLAGRMSPRAPLVLQPGWHRGRAGTVGLVVLILVIAGAAVFGATNSPTLSSGSALNPEAFRGTVRGRVPDCAREFPLPTGLTPQYGFDTGSSCQALLSSTQSPAPLVEAFRKTLAAARWKFTEDKRAPGSVVFSITGPRCATLAVVPAEGGASVALAFTPCSSPSPTAS